MTQIALQSNQDSISIEIQIPQFITHLTTQNDMEQVANHLRNEIISQFEFQNNQKVIEEVERLQKIKNVVEELKKIKKNQKRFSTFNTASASTEPSVEIKISQSKPEQFIKIFEDMEISLPSLLTGVVRFKNSPYAYTVKPDGWSSPFGFTGTDSLSFLNNISDSIFHHTESEKSKFLDSVAKYL
jgi:hypothetical protein